MDDLDDVIGLLNSNKPLQQEKQKLQAAGHRTESAASLAELQEISERKLNIERMMEELEAMKAKKQELLERNNRLKEN